MSSYVEETLTTGETVLLTTRIALRRYWANFALGGFLLVVTLVSFFVTFDLPEGEGSFESPADLRIVNGVWLLVAVLLIAFPIIRYFTNELALTNKRLIAKFGLFSLSTIELGLEQIESLRVKQGLFGRLLGYGTVVVVGVGGSREPITNIPDPVNFRINFGAALEKLKSVKASRAA